MTRPAPTSTSARLDRTGLTGRLASALRRDAPEYAGARLLPLPDKGLAHDHVQLEGQGIVARIPKQSQMGLAAEDNLAYQAACFARASAGGHAPALHAVLPPSPELPRGALLVDYIEGDPPRLPQHLGAIAEALASIHALPLPPADARPPLKDEADPLADLVAEVERQAAYIDEAKLDAAAGAAIHAELAELKRLASEARRPHKALISFDAHPGNFIIRRDGSAVLVDLEKGRYAYPPLDLAHATLYTSTTWDVATYAELSSRDVERFVAAWQHALGHSAASWLPWVVPLRRAMWLWSVTWCAKWRVLSARERKRSSGGEDWSAGNSEADLVRHVRGRVDCYLSPSIIEQVRAECATLARSLPG